MGLFIKRRLKTIMQKMAACCYIEDKIFMKYEQKIFLLEGCFVCDVQLVIKNICGKVLFFGEVLLSCETSNPSIAGDFFS